MAPAGAVFSVVLFTEAWIPPFLRRRRKDKSRMDRKSLDLCGMAAIRDILSSFGGLSLMESYSTSRACFVRTFSAALVLKCAIASGDRAELCGPLATASHISSFVHGLPVCVGHPNVAQSLSNSAAGCCSASPFGHIEFR